MSLLLLFRGGDVVPPPPPPPPTPRELEFKAAQVISRRLAIEVISSDGREYRWGGDTWDSGEMPEGLEWSSSIPGGWKSMSCRLARRTDMHYQDLRRFNKVRVYGAGNRTAFEGHLSEIPRSSDEGEYILPAAVGHQNYLLYNPDYRDTIVDRAFANWGEMPLAERSRQLLFTGGGGARDLSRLSWTTEGGVLIAFDVDGYTQPNAAAIWYAAPPGCRVKRVQYKGKVTKDGADVPESSDAYWANAPQRVQFADQDSISDNWCASPPFTMDNAIHEALPTVVGGSGTPGSRRWAVLNADTYPITTSPGKGATRQLSKIAVFGDNAIPLIPVTGDCDAVYASDVLVDALQRVAPKIHFTIGEGGSIDPTTFPIPHLVFERGVNAAAVLQEINRWHQYDWAVYEGMTLLFKPAMTYGRNWRIWKNRGARVNEEGETIEDAIDSVIVTFTDYGGVTQSVGPPGTRTSFTSSLLQDTSPTNPVVEAGESPKRDELDAGVLDLNGAIKLGQAYMREKNSRSMRGDAIIWGLIEDDGGQPHPVAFVKAGDTVQIMDSADTRRRKIVDTRYNHDDQRLELGLDAPPNRLEVILEQLGVSLAGAGL